MYEVAEQSRLKTRIFATRHNADYQLPPITSDGYRLCLTYNIIDPTPAIPRMPPFTDMRASRSRLEAALPASKNDPDANYFEYMLQNSYHYSQSLTGPDAFLAFHTRQIAEELQLELYLVFTSSCRNCVGEHSVNSSEETDASFGEEPYKHEVGDSMYADYHDADVTVVDTEGHAIRTTMNTDDRVALGEEDRDPTWFEEGKCNWAGGDESRDINIPSTNFTNMPSQIQTEAAPHSRLFMTGGSHLVICNVQPRILRLQGKEGGRSICQRLKHCQQKHVAKNAWPAIDDATYTICLWSMA
ncbi:hypothetical protein C8R43DRAFT_42305 [Mycena crocata]|nr:hypothetical protein C8R43DRAFT_42305 [Mycena crocata]